MVPNMPETSVMLFWRSNSTALPQTCGCSRNGSSAIWTRLTPLAWSCWTRLSGSVGWSDQLQTASRWANDDVITCSRAGVPVAQFKPSARAAQSDSLGVYLLDARCDFARLAARAIRPDD